VSSVGSNFNHKLYVETTNSTIEVIMEKQMKNTNRLSIAFILAIFLQLGCARKENIKIPLSDPPLSDTR
jgi:hexokinase